MSAIVERLAEGGVRLLLEGVVFGVLTLVAAAMARGLARRGRVWIGSNAGRTCMSPFVLLVGLLCAAAAAAFLATGLYFRESLQEPSSLYAWAGLVGAFALVSLAIFPFARHTWEWDAAGLRWHGAWRSVSMRWSDLERLGKSINGRFYVVDKPGRKIAWSQHTLEHQALLRAIQTARPDLVMPAKFAAGFRRMATASFRRGRSCAGRPVRRSRRSNSTS